MKTIDTKYLPEQLQFGEIELTLSNFTDDGGSFGIWIDKCGEIVDGKKYDVIFDGVLYENVECFLSKGFPILGASYDDLFNNVGYPFNVQYSRSEHGCYVSARDDKTHTIKIEGILYDVRKLDEKYLNVVLSSPNGTRYQITVDDDGTIKATAI